MTAPAALEAPTARLVGLDRLRGLAVALMVADHLLIVLVAETGLGGEVRATLTRLSMPLFFLVAGALVTTSPRLSLAKLERLGWVLLAGVVVPVVVPWVDNPNVLLWYVAGFLVVWGVRRFRPAALFPLTLGVVLVALALLANGYSWRVGSGYDPVALLAFMLLGTWMRGSLEGWGARLPAWVGPLGRFPLSTYVVHLVLIELVWLVGHGGV